MDVEDLARLGRRTEACPYYAARAALPEADLVLLPYSALLAQVAACLGSSLPCALTTPSVVPATEEDGVLLCVLKSLSPCTSRGVTHTQKGARSALVRLQHSGHASDEHVPMLLVTSLPEPEMSLARKEPS
jgi:hypothetical protein